MHMFILMLYLFNYLFTNSVYFEFVLVEVWSFPVLMTYIQMSIRKKSVYKVYSLLATAVKSTISHLFIQELLFPLIFNITDLKVS